MYKKANDKNVTKSFFARLLDKLDKKMKDKADKQPCCCNSRDKDKKSCCS